MESRSVSNKVTFEYFFIYLLPGSIISLGIFFLTRLCNLHSYTIKNASLFEVIVFLLISFAVGLAFSGVSDRIVDFFYWMLRITKPSGKLVMKELHGELIDSFRSEFNIRVRKSRWSDEYFYLVRNAVDQFMPDAARAAHRQGALRLIRCYLIFPVILWTVNGIMFSVKEVPASQNQLILLLTILAVGYFLTISLWLSMKDNAVKEIRFTLIAFVSLSKSRIMRDRTGIYY